MLSRALVKKILTEYQFRPRKRLGQNFLINDRVMAAIISMVDPQQDDIILEIGAGLGLLTGKLAEKAAQIMSVELDGKLAAILKERVNRENVEVIEQDILEVDLGKLVCESAQRMKVTGNLPYYITTPILFHLFGSKSVVENMVIMVQREVGERMAALPGGKDYGALSIASQYYLAFEGKMVVKGKNFFPEPGVDSLLLKLRMLAEPAVKPISEDYFFKVVRAAFGQRRKVLRNSLAGLPDWSLEKKQLEKVIEEAGIDPGQRAETLYLSDFVRLSDHLYARRKQ